MASIYYDENDPNNFNNWKNKSVFNSFKLLVSEGADIAAVAAVDGLTVLHVLGDMRIQNTPQLLIKYHYTPNDDNNNNKDPLFVKASICTFHIALWIYIHIYIYVWLFCYHLTGVDRIFYLFHSTHSAVEGNLEG